MYARSLRAIGGARLSSLQTSGSLLYKDNGKEHGNYYDGVTWGYMGFRV